MAKIYNSDCTKGLAQNAGIQTSAEKVPNELAEKIVPTFETNPEQLRRTNILRSNSAINATSGTIYTTPTDKDFYLCGVAVSVIKDVTSTSLYTCITGTPEGQAVTDFLLIRGITLTPQENCCSLEITPPLKMKKGTTIVVTNSTNVANISSSGTIYGYVVDNSNA